MAKFKRYYSTEDTEELFFPERIFKAIKPWVELWFPRRSERCLDRQMLEDERKRPTIYALMNLISKEIKV